MSLGELLVIAIIALLVMKPEDIKDILKQLYKLKNYFSSAKKEIVDYINSELNIAELEEHKEVATENLEEINFYLEKIISLEGKYKGYYELGELKSRYNDLVTAKVKAEKEENFYSKKQHKKK